MVAVSGGVDGDWPANGDEVVAGDAGVDCRTARSWRRLPCGVELASSSPGVDCRAVSGLAAATAAAAGGLAAATAAAAAGGAGTSADAGGLAVADGMAAAAAGGAPAMVSYSRRPPPGLECPHPQAVLKSDQTRATLEGEFDSRIRFSCRMMALDFPQ